VTATRLWRTPGVAAEAREARGRVEDALDQIGWPWTKRLSLYLDLLFLLEESASRESA
jgi:hypothetical protein